MQNFTTTKNLIVVIPTNPHQSGEFRPSTVDRPVLPNQPTIQPKMIENEQPMEKQKRFQWRKYEETSTKLTSQIKPNDKG